MVVRLLMRHLARTHKKMKQRVPVQVTNAQGPCTTNVQGGIRYLRKAEAICTDSTVGEAECNGRAAGATRRVGAKLRTTRPALEANVKAMVGMRGPVATWMVRWAGEILTTYTAGNGGLAARERRRGQTCTKPIAMFGANVFLITTAHRQYTCQTR